MKKWYPKAATNCEIVTIPCQSWHFHPSWTKSKRRRDGAASRSFARDSSQFKKRSQLFICVHNVTLSVAPMRISNPDCSPLRING